MFKKYVYGGQKKKIRELIRKKNRLVDKSRYHAKKHEQIVKIDLLSLEKELNVLLKKVGNKFK